jgi:hypothetical protein
MRGHRRRLMRASWASLRDGRLAPLLRTSAARTSGSLAMSSPSYPQELGDWLRDSTEPVADQFPPCILRKLRISCQTASKRAPGSASNRDPLWALGQACPGSEREGPARSGVITTSPTERSAGGACLPTGASRGGTASQARCLKRQLSLPVSMISQQCARGSR